MRFLVLSAQERCMSAMRRRFGPVMLCAIAAGCATHGQPVTQTLRVETPGWPGASCDLANDRGTWQVPSTPGPVTVATSAQPLRVACRAVGSSGGVGMPSTVNQPTSGAGAVAGGVLGGAAIATAVGATALTFIPALGVITVGLGVATGAIAGNTAEASRRELRYPDQITVMMSSGPTTALGAPAPGPRLGIVVRGLAVVEARERGLGERAAVLVTAVSADGRAQRAGLLADDVVLAADGVDVVDAADLEARVRALASAAPLRLTVWRGGRVLDVVVAPATTGS